MKKILIISLMYLGLPVMADCSWDTAKVIWDEPFWGDDTVKVCGLSHQNKIIYSRSDLLNGLNTAAGSDVVFGGSPESKVNIGLTDVTIVGGSVPDLSLKKPSPYYLTNSGNYKNDTADNTVGIFRFYSRPGLVKCDNPIAWYGYNHIRKHMVEDFLNNIKVNNKMVGFSSGYVAEARGVVLAQGGSTMNADVFFIEGKREQSGRICSIDVYVKLQLKPNNTLKYSGDYPLKFTVH